MPIPLSDIIVAERSGEELIEDDLPVRRNVTARRDPVGTAMCRGTTASRSSTANTSSSGTAFRIPWLASPHVGGLRRQAKHVDTLSELCSSETFIGWQHVFRIDLALN